MPGFVVAAVAFTRNGSVLTVRKRGTRRFMLPGGKVEASETPEETARREVVEEIGVQVGSLQLLGQFAAPAANEPGHRVTSTVFLAQLAVVPRAMAEIEEVRWSSVDQPEADLAPLLLDCVIPALRAHHMT